MLSWVSIVRSAPAAVLFIPYSLNYWISYFLFYPIIVTHAVIFAQLMFSPTTVIQPSCSLVINLVKFFTVPFLVHDYAV